ncbi:MAG: hypothetical protein ABJB86_21880, partial [Bacteroidota bacterium]
SFSNCKYCAATFSVLLPGLLVPLIIVIIVLLLLLYAGLHNADGFLPSGLALSYKNPYKSV